MLGGCVLAVWLITHPCSFPPFNKKIRTLSTTSFLPPFWLLSSWWMTLEVKSDEDTLEFDHVKKHTCEGKRKCASMFISVSPYALARHMAHSLTHPDVGPPPLEIWNSSQQEWDSEPLLLNLLALRYLLVTPYTWLMASRVPCIQHERLANALSLAPSGLEGLYGFLMNLHGLNDPEIPGPSLMS